MQSYSIRNAHPNEFKAIGQLMVEVYSQLEGFPKPEAHPVYYEMLAKVGELTQKEGTELLVAVSSEGEIAGAVVYFNDIRHYGADDIAAHEKEAAGFRLLAVGPSTRGAGLGKRLTIECINKAKEANHKQVIIHSTNAMKLAWGMYERLGFRRSEDLDFSKGTLQIFGFRLKL